MSSQKAISIALIVTSRNEQLVADYVKKHLDEFALFKLVVTKTENSLIKKLFSQMDPPHDNVTEISWENEEVEKRIVHNQLSAVFVMNYPILMKQYSAEIMATLCEKASNSDTLICFSPSNIDLALTSLVNMKGVTSGVKQNLVRINPVLQNVLLTRFPSFDIEERDRSKVGRWAIQQYSYWLDTMGLQFLKPFLDKEKYGSATEDTSFILLDEPKNCFRLKSAPLQTSLDILTIPSESSLNLIFDYQTFERDFLISHSMFTTSLDLMKALIARYPTPPSRLAGVPEQEGAVMKTSTSVINVLRDWILMEYGHDFAGNTELLQVFDEFTANELSKDDSETAKELKELLDTAMALKPPYPVDLSKAPKPLLMKKMKPGKFDLLTLNPTEIARQMTLMDEQLFHKVRAKEFLGGAWTKDAKNKAPNLIKFINHANRVTAWLITEILKCTLTSRATELIIRLTQIGKELLELKNYAGVMNVLNALHSAPVGKLKAAWEALPGRETKDFDELTEALSLLGHFRNYRETLKTLTATTPCIPLLAVTCSDLNGLGEALENTTDDGRINWDKHQKVAHHIWSVKRFMRARYILKPVEEIQSYLSSGEAWEGEKTLVAIAKLRDQFGGTVLANDNIKKSTKTSGEEKTAKDYKMTERDWELLGTTGAEMKIHGVGEAIIPRGTVNRHLFRIKKGSVKIEQSFNGHTIIHRLKEKEIFGEMTLYFPVPIMEEAVVADEQATEIVKYKLDAVIDKCRAEPTLSEKLHRLIAKQLSLKLSTFGQKKSEDKKNSTASPIGVKRPKVTSLSADSPSESKKFAKMEKKASGRLNASSSAAGKKKKTAEDEFNKLFPTGSMEPLLKALTCIMKKAPNVKGSKGTIYLTSSFLFFSADVFGRKIKEKYPLGTFREIKLEANTNRILIELASTSTLIFKDFENVNEAHTILSKLIELKKSSHSDTVEQQEVEKTDEGEDTGLGLSEEEWIRIMEGTRSLHFGKDDHVITQGKEQPQRLYQIANGSCRIEKTLDAPPSNESEPTLHGGNTVVLAIIKDTDATVFGEISFLEGPGGKATASVVANEPNTTVHVIEGYYLNILFEYYPGLSGRFYHYLGSVIGKRLRQREADMLKREAEDESEMDGDEEKSEASERLGDSIPEGNESKPKKNLVKRTQDQEKKNKKRRKSSNRIVVHKEEDLIKEKEDKKED